MLSGSPAGGAGEGITEGAASWVVVPAPFCPAEPGDGFFSAVSSGRATDPPLPVVSPDDLSRSDLSGDSPATDAS
ncbi:hypothetical protein AN220_25870 [Streptomyces nanshensis]|nr:hypothetical protein AN220_25870 [Streptomyces nanshensis]